VIPGECQLYLDWRSVPEEEPQEIVERLEEMLKESLTPGGSGSVETPEVQQRTYTGLSWRVPNVFHSFLLPLEHPLLRESRRILQEALERPVEVMTWRFCTDGGHTMRAGIPTIGFAPGEEGMAHIIGERISVDLMEEALVGYMALALGLTEHRSDAG
jgi:acetylornithine deacetylase/succinyl-diaminopimelate desuccinylase-like protein